MAEFPEKVVPHLHLCLQSGSDSVLRRMRRRWGTKMFLDRCRLLRESLDRPAITTDIIAGFPGETEEEFEQTLRTCREAGFSKIHAFPYSARRGTPAAERDDQLDKGLISERVDRLGEVEAELRQQYYETLVGSDLELLVEEVTPDGRLQGTTCRYALGSIERPENVGEADSLRENDLIKARVVRVQDDRLELA